MARAYKYPLVNGHKIHFRKVQVLIWGVILALVFSRFIAGLYWLAFQQDYFGHSLKLWWDNGMGFIHSGNWVLYRHGWRDRIEPAAATVGVLSFVFGVKANSKAKKVHGLFTMIVLVLVLLVVASAMAFGEVWVLHFGIHGLTSIQAAVLGLALSIISGKILHYIWLPAAASVQYHILDGPVSRRKTPFWVSLALAPPTLRERFSDLSQRFSKGEITMDDKDAPSKMDRMIISFVIFAFSVITVIGFIAADWIGKGHTVPFIHS